MSATVEGVLKIVDRASQPIDKIKKSGAEATKVTESLGKKLDNVGAPSKAVAIEKTNKALSNTGKQAGESNRKLEKMLALLKDMEKQRATAKVDVDITKAEAKIRILKEQIRKLTTKEARAEMAALGLEVDELGKKLGGGGGGGPPGQFGGGGGGRAGGLAAGFAAAGGRAIFMAAMLAAAAPAVVSFTGAISALVGSLGAAAGGGLALGTGAIGGLVVGLGGIVAVAKPAISAMKELKKEQDAYNKIVQKYGANSAQAVTAHKQLSTTKRQNPGAGAVLQNSSVLSSRFKAQTTSARGSFFGILNDGLATANDLLPTFGRTTNYVMRESRDAVDEFLAPFRTPEWKGIIRDLGGTAGQSAGPVARSLGNMALWLGRIARAARPEVVRMFDSMEGFTARLAGGAKNQAREQSKISGMVDQLSAWVRLIGTAAKLAKDFFGAGAERGKSEVEGITDLLDRWDKWVQHNPAKVDDFFRRTIDSAKKLGRALGTVASEIGRIADSMIPVLNLASNVTNALGGAGPGGGLLGPLATYGALRFLRGKVGGKSGAAGGSLLGRFLGRGGAAAAAGEGGSVMSRLASGPGARFIASSGGEVVDREASTIGRLLRSGVGRIGTRLLGGAARKLGPLGLALGAYDFIREPGTVGERLQNVAHGASFGLIPAPKTRVEVRNEALQRAAGFKGKSDRDIRMRIGQLQGQLGATKTQHVTGYGDATTQKLQGKDRLGAQTELDKLKATLHMRVVFEDKNKALTSFDDLVNAFDIRMRKLGQSKAENEMFDGLKRQMKRLGPDGKRTLLQATAEWTGQLEDGNKKQRKMASDLKDFITNQYQKLGKNVSVANGQILTGTQKEWSGIRKAMSSEAERALEEVSKHFTDLQRQAVGSLVAMGFSRGEASKIVSGLESGGAAGQLSRGTVRSGGNATQTRNRLSGIPAQANNATGGRLRGIGLADSLNIGGNNKAAPGELVVNRHTERKIDQRLGFPGALGMLVNGEHTPHGMNVMHATGGRLSGGIAQAIQMVRSHFPQLGISSTTGGTHAPGSFHYRGLAADLTGPPGVMNAAAAWIAAHIGGGLAEGIHNPNLSIKNGRTVPASFWGASTWADHLDHIHMAVLGPALAASAALGGGLGIPGIKLRPKKSRLGGVPGALSSAATRAQAAGLQQMVNQRIGAMGGGGGTSGANQALGKRMMMAMGWGPNQWPSLQALWTRESGWNANAVNPSSGAYGIPQALGHGHPFALGDARAQIAWGLNYIKGRYGSPAAAMAHERSAGWYSYGGRTPAFGGWYGNGGSFVASKPTLIGVGEKGRERVTITPEGRAGGAPVIYVKIGKIVNNRKGDIERELKEALNNVARQLVHAPLDGEDELS